jgi:hypothetical protein
MRKFLKIILAASLACTSIFVAPTVASAQEVYSYFTTAETFEWYSFDMNSSITMAHPDKVICANTDYSGNPTCEIKAKARFTNSKPASYVQIEMVDETGKVLAKDYLWTSYGTAWQDLNFTSSLTSSTNATFRLATSTSFSSTSQSTKTYLFAGPTPEFSVLEVPFSSEVSESSTTSVNWANGKFTFIQIYFPTRIRVSEACFDYQVFVRPIDYETGETGLENVTDGLSFDLSVERETDSWNYEPAENGISAASGEWLSNGEPTELTTKICGASDKLGVVRNFNVTFTVELDGLVSQFDFDESFSTVGTQLYKSINCLKGKNIKVVSSPSPKCPTGYVKTNLPTSNGKLKPTTITCIRALQAKKITGILPSCPSGWTRR